MTYPPKMNNEKKQKYSFLTILNFLYDDLRRFRSGVSEFHPLPTGAEALRGP